MTVRQGNAARAAQPRVGAAHVAVAAIAAWFVLVLVDGLSPGGRSFVVLGAMRVVLFGLLLAFALSSGAAAGRLGRAALVLAGIAAGGYLFGGVGAVATDGWSYNPFSEENAELAPPWYAYVLLASGMLFAIATVLVGVAGRARRPLWLGLVAAGVLYPAVFALQGPLGATTGVLVGHVLWLGVWLAVAVAMVVGGSRSRHV